MTSGGNATLRPLATLQPTEADGFLIAAKNMLAGARQLKRVRNPSLFSITHLCGHSSECALKAVLAHNGMRAEDLKKRFGHDIEKLWQCAKGLVLLPDPQPAWVAHLNRVHNRPFLLRYPLGLHGLGLPNTSEMLRGTEQLVKLADTFVKAPDPTQSV